MNNAVSQPAVADIAITAAKQNKMPKEKNADGEKFMSMLSDAINSKSDETVKSPETSEESTSAANEFEQSPIPEQPEEQPAPTDQDGDVAYEQQAVAVAMQMQGMFPIITVMPQTEITGEPDAMADETLDVLPVQATQTIIAAQKEAAAAEVFQPEAAQDIQSSEAETETVTAEKPQTAEFTAKTETQSKLVETAAPRIAQTEEAAPDIKINRQEPQQVTAQPEAKQPEAKQPEVKQPETAHPEAIKPETIQTQATPQPQITRPQTIQTQAAQRQTIRRETDAGSEETPKVAVDETAASGETETQVLRQPRPPIQMHNMRHPQEAEAAQTKFDGMIARASQQLNQNATVQEVPPEIEIQEETPTGERAVILEAKPHETAKQPENAKAEIKPAAEAKPEEETKTAERAAAQKSVKAPVTEQRPQNEISKSDETLFHIAQQKQPEIRHEIIRNDPAPQQPQPVQTPDQAEQIKAQVIRNMESERTEFQMQLQPEELGKVNVKMVLEGGKLSVEIAAINPKSVEMLSRQAESLAASLKASGADVSSINIVTATESTSAEMDGAYDLNNFQNRFQNHEGGQGHNRRSKGTGETGEQAESAGQTERENPKAPQRILNYSV